MLEMFDLAAKIATKRLDRRTFFLGAVGVRSDGAIVHARNESTECPNPEAHAERRLSKRLDYGATVFVVRVAGIRNGKPQYSMARPCAACLVALKSRRVKTVYYTIAPNEMGVIRL